MGRRKTSVEIDEDLLAEVREILETSTVKETIDEAFREVVRRRARREEIVALETMQGMDLDQASVMDEAWAK
jgi:Arc/MetJ family transcription regulator